MNTVYSDIEMARSVQQALLNRPRQILDYADIAATCRAATHVGGDFFTLSANQSERLTSSINKPGIIEYRATQQPSLTFGIGDVAGHGISSALVMALVMGILNEFSRNKSEPSPILKELNDELCRYLKGSSVPYVTAILGIFFPNDHRLTICRAGHPYPILIRAEEKPVILESDGVFLGMFEDESFNEHTYTINQGDRLILYTDGITECKNANAEEFGIERLLEFSDQHRSLSPNEFTCQLLEILQAYSQTQDLQDDQTIMVIDLKSNA